MSLLEIKNLSVHFQTDEGRVEALKKVSLTIPKGKVLGLVGESGSGKSVTALSIMRLVPTPPGRIAHGEILFEDQDLLKLPASKMRRVRGAKISMIFQEPMTSLNPVFTVGDQISESLMIHKGLTRAQALGRSVELMQSVGIKNASQRLKSYPHELSGGQRQRVMIAMAISCSPKLLIADEPTTALDVTVQKKILELLKELQKTHDMSVLFVTHDLGVVAEVADEVAVMRKGHIVERQSTRNIFLKPKSPYTKGLLACRPHLETNYERLPVVSDFMDDQGLEIMVDKEKLFKEKSPAQLDKAPVLLEVHNLCKTFPLETNFFGKVLSHIHAVKDVSFKVHKGKTLGVVGESGCGKTTLGRSILRLTEPTSGSVIYNDIDILSLNGQQLRQMRRKMQIIFQDPYASLNPSMTIQSTLIEPMQIHQLGGSRKERLEKAEALMEKVGLPSKMLNRYPHEFSGGQRQRICIARALAVEPDFIICDESVSALDVSTQAQILNLLRDLQKEMNLTYIFISHDLAVVKFFADELVVMKSGEIVEKGPSLNIYQHPRVDYTKKLLDAIPKGIKA